MDEVFIIIADSLKGKSIYPIVRRTLNFLFIASITSFLYEWIYGEYFWLDFDDYKSILDFFIKGSFFVPFSIFLIVYGTSQFLSTLFFSLVNHFKTLKINRKIITYKVKKEYVDDQLKKISEATKTVVPVELKEEQFIELYNQVRNEITAESLNEMEEGLKEPKQNLEANFHFLFRGLLAITIYFISLPQYGWILYTFTFLIVVGFMYLIMIAYRLLEVFPTFMKKFKSSAEEYIDTHYNQTPTIEDNGE